MIRWKSYVSNVAICLAATTALASGVAHAQEVGVSPDSGEEASQFDADAIVVTAQRRDQLAQDVPISLTAFGGAELEARGITDLSALVDSVPGFYFSNPSPLRPYLFIRGIGTRTFDPGSDPSVGVFVDDIYIGNRSGASILPRDIEQVQILKGPQGTLFGRNAVAGALAYNTNNPTSELEGSITAGIGNRGAHSVVGVVSGPISGDSLTARLVAYGDYSDGYVTNLNTGQRMGGVGDTGVKLKVKASADGGATAMLTLERLSRRTNILGSKNINIVNGVPLQFFKKPGVIDVVVDDPYADFYNSDGPLRETMTAITARIEVPAGIGDFISITGYRENDQTSDYDLDSGSLDITRVFTVENTSQISQELRFVSDENGPLSLDGMLSLVGGLYFFHSEAYRQDRYQAGVDNRLDGIEQVGAGNYQTESAAIYGQADFSITPQLVLSLGARYTKDWKEAQITVDADGVGFLVSETYSSPLLNRSFNSFDPRVALSYEITPDMMVYASWAKGFKSGGFQSLPGNLARAQTSFEPERVTSYEAGIKSQWLGRALTANVAIWQSDYENLQVVRGILINGVLERVTSNAATSRLKGIDAELSLRLGRDFRVGANYAYLDAEYLDYIDGATDYSGTRMERAPEHSVQAFLQYTLPLSGDSDLTLRADQSYTSEVYFDPGQGMASINPSLPLTVQSGYGLTGLRATYENGPIRVTAYVDNLLDKLYKTSDFTTGPLVYAFYGEPRTYGMNVSWTF